MDVKKYNNNIPGGAAGETELTFSELPSWREVGYIRGRCESLSGRTGAKCTREEIYVACLIEI